MIINKATYLLVVELRHGYDYYPYYEEVERFLKPFEYYPMQIKGIYSRFSNQFPVDLCSKGSGIWPECVKSVKYIRVTDMNDLWLQNA